MTNIGFHIVQPDEQETIQRIANWYLDEWNIPKEKTLHKLALVANDPSQFHVVMTMDDVPIATGGVHHRVGLLDKEPRLAVHKHWLALVYTTPKKRHQGLGAMLCNYIHEHSTTVGANELYLYTDTAERLYHRLGWRATEQLSFGERMIVVMKKRV